MRKGKRLPKDVILSIREQVLNGKSKSQLSREIHLPVSTVWYHTKDIPAQKKISPQLIDCIREEVRNGKSKFQIARDYDLYPKSVYYWTKDIPSRNCGWPGLRGKTLDLLQEIMVNGYVVPDGRFFTKHFLTLHKYFPQIYRIKIYNKQVFLLKGKEELAVRAFLDSTRKKIISYQELRYVTKVFGADISKKEKEVFLCRKRGAKGIKNRGVQKEGSLLLDSDSFSFFYIRKYCPGFKNLEKDREIDN